MDGLAPEQEIQVISAARDIRHDGVQVSVTPAPDADRAEGTKQNAGVNGTTYSVSDRPGSPTSRWTAGGRRSANGRQAASPPKAAGVQYADSGVDDVSAEIDEATDVDGGRRRDDGIAILEGIVTTEVPPDDDDGPPTADLDVPQPVWNQPSSPRPVRAAATDSAAAGKRTSSGDLPVSVTPPAWDSGPRPIRVRDLPPDVQLRFWRLRRDHHDRRRRACSRSSPGAGRSASRSRSWPGSSTPSTGRGTRPRTSAAARARQPRRAHQRQLARMRREGYFALERAAHPRQPASSSTTWSSARPASTRSTRRSGIQAADPHLERQAALPRPRVAEAAARARRVGGGSRPARSCRPRSAPRSRSRPALAIYGPKIPWDIATIRNVDVFTGPALRKYLKRRGRMKDGVAAAHPRGSPHDLRHGSEDAAGR